MYLKVKDFGPIGDFEWQMSKCLFLMGPQASGKSTISKALFFFLSLREELEFLAMELLNTRERDPKRKLREFTKATKQRFLDIFGASFHRKGMELYFEYSKGISLTLTVTKMGYLSPTFSKLFIHEFHSLNQSLEEHFESSISWSPRQASIPLEKGLHKIFDFKWDLLYIPAGRSLVSLLTETLMTVPRENLDALMRAFIEKVKLSRNVFNKSLAEVFDHWIELGQDRSVVDAAIQTIQNILHAEFRTSPSGDQLWLKDGSHQLLKYASSGQQEAVWLVLLVYRYIVERQKVFVVFEEPEAHLYPEAQQEMVRLIALLLHQEGNSGIVTTHSPYIVSSFNNHLYACDLAKTYPEQVKALMPEPFWLNIDDTSAFFIDKGQVEDLIDHDLKQIRLPLLDRASQKINDEYDQLMALDERP